jgi:hypothetical protein
MGHKINESRKAFPRESPAHSGRFRPDLKFYPKKEGAMSIYEAFGDTLSAGQNLSDTLRERFPQFMREIAEFPHPLRTKKFNEKASTLLPFSMSDDSIDRILTGRLGDDPSFLKFRNIHDVPIHERAAFDLIYFLWKKPRIFQVSEDLGTLLKRTDPKGVTYDLLQLPFECVYVQLPKVSNLKVWFDNPTAANGLEEKPLEGFYAILEEVAGQKWLVFLCVSGADVPLDDCLFSMPMRFEPGDIEPQLEERLNGFLERKKSRADRLNIDQFKDVFRWAVNCILYITCDGADIKREWLHPGLYKKMRKATGKRKTKLKHELGRISEQVHIVGRTITIRKPSGSEPKEPDGKTKRSPSIHWVRGFFRQQPHGPGKTLRRLKWIKPFLRGEGRDVVDKIYKVE